MRPPLKRPISPDSPILILQRLPGGTPAEEATHMVALWEQLDADIRAYAAVQIGRHQPERNRVLLARAAEANIPIVLQVQGNNGDRQDTMPVDEARRLVAGYPAIVGLEIAEASQRTFADHTGGPEIAMGRNARYARDIIRLCGEYRLFLPWQLLWDNFLAVGCSADNEALFDAIVENGDCVVPMHEMNAEVAKLTAHIGAMGLWASGATANWGVEAQSWYWHDAGYNRPGTYVPGTIEMPGPVYAIMFLLGASAGACAYAIEPPRDIWPGEEGAWRFADWMVPVFRRLVSERLIPAREDVLATMPVAYHMPVCRRSREYRAVLDDLDVDHGEGRLIRAAYGQYDRARDVEMIPNNPRYGWIPALPAKTPESVLGHFRHVLRPGDIASVEQAREILDEYFPPVDRGEAWSRPVGAGTIAANTHENWFVPESVNLTVPARPTDVRIESRTLVWSARDGDRAYRVWRLRDGREDRIAEVAAPNCRHSLSDLRHGDRYAVSAITSATETISRTLHLHDFLLLSARESRRSPWASVAGDAVEGPRIGEEIAPATDAVLAAEARCAECTPVEDLASPRIAEDDPDRGTKRAVMGAIIDWKRAIEREDVAAILESYDPEYREPDGRTTESVGVAFRSIFWRCLAERAGSVARDWGTIHAWRSPIVRIIVRDWVVISPDEVDVDTVVTMWAGGGPELEPSDMLKHPWERTPDLRMRWRRSPDRRWRIYRTTPTFLTMEDVAIFRWCYTGW